MQRGFLKALRKGRGLIRSLPTHGGREAISTRALFGCMVGVFLSGGIFIGCKDGSESTKPPEAVHVEVAEVLEAPLEKTLSAVGGLSSPQVTMISPQTAGRVVFLDINQGDLVDEGKVIARLDDSVEKAAVAAAKATLENARQIYERDKKVVGIGAISRQQLETDKAAVRRAEAQLEQAEANLAHTVIRAPFTGMLGLKQVSLGAYLNEGDSIVQIQQLNPLYLDFYLPQQHIGELELGQGVKITVVGLSGEFTGKVTTINPALAPVSRTIQLQATVPNPDNKLRPGMFATVELAIGLVPNALFIPMQAVVPEGQVRYVWVVGPGGDRAQRKKVEVGVYANNLVQITSGLKPTDRVVTAGTQKIYPNAELVTTPYQPIRNPRLDLANPEK